MRARFSKAFVAVSVVATALPGAACRKSDEHRREAQQATEEAEQNASETTITSAELGANERTDQAETITTTRKEQLEYRGKLQVALDELDAKRAEAKRRGRVHLTAIDAERAVLKHHLDALDRTADVEWGSLKVKIDRDLLDHAGAEGK